MSAGFVKSRQLWNKISWNVSHVKGTYSQQTKRLAIIGMFYKEQIHLLLLCCQETIWQPFREIRIDFFAENVILNYALGHLRHASYFIFLGMLIGFHKVYKCALPFCVVCTESFYLTFTVAPNQIVKTLFSNRYNTLPICCCSKKFNVAACCDSEMITGARSSSSLRTSWFQKW